VTTAWSREHLARLDDGPTTRTPVLTKDETIRMLPELYLWDLWPVRRDNGDLAEVEGREMWMALSASSGLDPGQRHDAARIRLIARGDQGWEDLGNLFPAGASLGSREWAGCATLAPKSGALDMYYTASGRAGEASPTFVQRIAHTSGWLAPGRAEFGNWASHREVVTPGGRYRSTSDQDTGEPGFIKAFRDPFRFTDPADSGQYLLFTASLADSATDFDGAIGIARSEGGSFSLLPPLVQADGVNNELERPHPWWWTASTTSSSPHRPAPSIPRSTVPPASTDSSVPRSQGRGSR
jgi:levansucrase